MDGSTISQLARRAGVPATTLRFYEQQGLLTPRRSASGYRLFDDEALDQLRFIATAKSLGLSLDDIGVLLRPWRNEGCREVQRALSPMLEQRGFEARERILALREFAARLDEARRMLDEIDRDGPCDAACPFLTRDRTTGASGSDASPPAPASKAPAGAGAACSLPEPRRRDRWARWAGVLAHATSRRLVRGRVHVELDPAVLDDGGAAELVALVRAEQGCCPTLEMALTVGGAVTVDARVPDEDALEVAVSLFGPLDTDTERGGPAGSAPASGSRR